MSSNVLFGCAGCRWFSKFRGGAALLLWTLLSFAFCVAEVQAAGLPAPALKAGQHVYRIPGDFDPPLIGNEGLAEIEREAHKLHFPYYVVVAENYGGSSTQELSDALDALVDTWAKNPRFDRATSSVAVLTYSPRKYRLLAGSKWRAQLGLEGQEGSQRFVDIFSSYVQGSSKDPKTGIIESMKALDTFVFDNSDPKRIAQKAEAARKEQAQREQQLAKERAEQLLRIAGRNLDARIVGVEGLLGQGQSNPADVKEARAALARARTVRNSSNPIVLDTAADGLGRIGVRMQRVVDAALRVEQERMRVERERLAAQERARQLVLKAQRERENREAMQKLKLQAALLGAFVLVIALLFWQWRRFRSLSSQFQEKTSAWEEALLNAANNHTRFFEERRIVTELANTTGRTKQKYDEVTHEVGAIYPTIEAMRERVVECKRIFEQGSFFKTKPLRQAVALLDAEFEFDTENMNRRSLFEPPVRIIKIKPDELKSQLEKQYAENIADWDELMQALTLRETIAQDAFPASDLTAMLDTATQKQIPHRWLSPHPLFGDEAADRRFYDDLNSLRLTDPLAYKQDVGAAKRIQEELRNVLSRLIQALALVEVKRVRVLPPYGETVIAPSDDPAVTLAEAFRADERLTGFLSSRDRVEEVEEQAQVTAGLYQTAIEQAATLKAAIDGVVGDIASFEVRLKNIGRVGLDTLSRLRQAEAVHSNASAAAALYGSGQRFLEIGEQALPDAKRLLSEKRHLEAQRRVQQGHGSLDSAEQAFAQCVQACNELDEQKRAYERELQRLADMEAEAERSLRRYGRSRSLGQFNGYASSGPADYSTLVMQISSYRQELDDEVRRARRAYEEEQARLERQREEERRRERDEERRRSSSSSSSGGDWSGGSSSSSGSSWSGGSSSSSGTDW